MGDRSMVALLLDEEAGSEGQLDRDRPLALMPDEEAGEVSGPLHHEEARTGGGGAGTAHRSLAGGTASHPVHGGSATGHTASAAPHAGAARELGAGHASLGSSHASHAGVGGAPAAGHASPGTLHPSHAS